mmetsp:Transcript_45006/g.88323  ORF Transcript_45006/g.88323 Transcript_45006/m.88323 type:complete len:361 (+) Transcript_45006:1405-2487(+)
MLETGAPSRPALLHSPGGGAGMWVSGSSVGRHTVCTASSPPWLPDTRNLRWQKARAVTGLECGVSTSFSQPDTVSNTSTHPSASPTASRVEVWSTTEHITWCGRNIWLSGSRELASAAAEAVAAAAASPLSPLPFLPFWDPPVLGGSSSTDAALAGMLLPAGTANVVSCKSPSHCTTTPRVEYTAGCARWRSHSTDLKWQVTLGLPSSSLASANAAGDGRTGARAATRAPVSLGVVRPVDCRPDSQSVPGSSSSTAAVSWCPSPALSLASCASCRAWQAASADSTCSIDDHSALICSGGSRAPLRVSLTLTPGLSRASTSCFSTAGATVRAPAGGSGMEATAPSAAATGWRKNTSNAPVL